MVKENETQKEDEAQKVVLEEIGRNERGISITGLVNNCDISRMRIRVAIAYLLGSGKIEEVEQGMSKLYYLI